MADTSYTQEKRALKIDKSPLGSGDELLLVSFSGREALSEPFSFTLDLLAGDKKINPYHLLGKSLTFSMPGKDNERRYFNGMVSRFDCGPAGTNDLRQYQAVVRPWLWFLSYSSNFKIFSDKTPKDILDEVFKARGFGHVVKFELSGEASKLEYCVQYGETDFAFVSRIMEREGYFYYFRHENGRHEMVVANGTSGYRDCPQKKLVYSSGTRGIEQIMSWDRQYDFAAGKWSHTDYDFEKSTNNLRTQTSSVGGSEEQSKYERYEYPGGYKETNNGQFIAKLRIEQEEVSSTRFIATSNCSTLFAGGKFQLDSDTPSPDKSQTTFVITAIEYSAGGDSYDQSGKGGYEQSNRFQGMPAEMVFRPPQITPKPTVQGIETAVVLGPGKKDDNDKDSVHTDKYGRIKVRFHWDRDENESCWVRTSQSVAGGGWGGVILPRVGQEVIVSFLGGDPDRPMITGCVYNGQLSQPFPMGENAYVSGIRTRSWPKGESSMYNELSFNDKKGEEAVNLQAQKDFTRYVKHDDSLKVDNDKSTEIKRNLTTTITEGDETRTLDKGKRSVTLDQGDDILKLTEGNRTVTLTKGNDNLALTGGNRTVKLDAGNDNLTLDSGNRAVKLLQGNHTLELTTGNVSTKLALGSSTTEAMQTIELKVGANSIKIDQTGITITGMQIKINADLMFNVKGAMGEIAGDGMLTIKGGMVMIN